MKTSLPHGLGQLLRATVFLLAASAFGLAARAQPIVTSLVPAAAPAGAMVVINGSGFATAPAQNGVYFGPARAAVVAATASQLTVRVPVGAASVGAVTVTDLVSQRLGSSLHSATPFFTVTFAGGPLSAASYQAQAYPLTTSRFGDADLTTAEFNGDGYADFAILADGVLLLVLSDGQGGYDPTPVRLAVGVFPSAIKAADVDANGTSDLLVGASGQLLVLRNLGNGNGFATPTALNLSSQRLINASPMQLEVQDMDGDGRPDIVALTTDNALAAGIVNLVALRNNGAGFDAPAVLLQESLRSLAVADFTQDGRLDILTVSRPNAGSSPTQLLLLAGTAAGYAAPAATSLPNVSFTTGPLVADVNADGRPDAVLGGSLLLPGGNQVGIGVITALRTPTGFALQGPYGERPPNGVSTLPALADADGDGRADAFTTVAGPAFTVLPGQADGSFANGPSFGTGIPTRLVTGDFTNDGRTDVATFDVSNGNLTIFRYTGASATANNPPTLNPLADLTLDEDAPQQTVALSGISNGGDAGQATTLTAVSSDPALIPNPTIAYFSPTATGTLRFKPAPDAFGTCTITVTVSDGQATNGTLSRSFRVTVNPVNDAPTLDPIPDVVITTVEPQTKRITVNLSGITSGAANENQILSLSSLASDVSGYNVGTFTYTSPATTGQFQLNAYVSGGAPRLLGTVSITVSDGQPTSNTLTRTFRVYYNPGGAVPNIPPSPPTLDALADVTANRALPTQLPVALTGIDDGDPTQTLPLTVTASSSDPDLVSVGPVAYASPAATGALPYTISSTRGGTATVSVVVSNGQLQNGSVRRSFRVTVPGPAVVTATTGPAGPVAFSLYPNPAPGGRFAVVSPAPGPLDVLVLDLSGREISRRRLAPAGLPELLELPTATPPGVYLVRVRSAQGTAVRRLVVN